MLKRWKAFYLPTGISITIAILSLIVWHNLKELRLKQNQKELDLITNSISTEIK